MINSWKGFYLGNFFVEYFFFLSNYSFIIFSFFTLFSKVSAKRNKSCRHKKNSISSNPAGSSFSVGQKESGFRLATPAYLNPRHNDRYQQHSKVFGSFCIMHSTAVGQQQQQQYIRYVWQNSLPYLRTFIYGNMYTFTSKPMNMFI